MSLTFSLTVATIGGGRHDYPSGLPLQAYDQGTGSPNPFIELTSVSIDIAGRSDWLLTSHRGLSVDSLVGL